MPPRKYADLSHLSPEEYRKESLKRREAERKEYHHKKYLKNCDLNRLEERKKRLEEAIALASAKQEELAAEGKIIHHNTNNGGTVEGIPSES
jgi:hypothetical protein